MNQNRASRNTWSPALDTLALGIETLRSSSLGLLFLPSNVGVPDYFLAGHLLSGSGGCCRGFQSSRIYQAESIVSRRLSERWRGRTHYDFDRQQLALYPCTYYYSLTRSRYRLRGPESDRKPRVVTGAWVGWFMVCLVEPNTALSR
jgi:hypothetical protein